MKRLIPKADWGLKLAQGLLELLGTHKDYKSKQDPKKDLQYRQNLYNLMDPTGAYPTNIEGAWALKNIADEASKDSTFVYKRNYIDPTSDAAWAKRLGLGYDKTLLIDNGDGTVRLSPKVEAEIPVDTTFLKNRIDANKKLLERYEKMGGDSFDRRKAINLGINYDQQALDSLRHTYQTGKPVQMNEQAFKSRKWIKDGLVQYTPSPLNALQTYTVQYDKKNNKMNYRDLYDFNGFENWVPGESFKIKGSINLNKND